MSLNRFSIGICLLLMLATVKGQSNESLAFECKVRDSNVEAFSGDDNDYLRLIDKDQTYVFYAQEDKFLVTGQYIECQDEEKGLCLCSFHIKMSDSYYYADQCYRNRYEPIDVLKAYSSSGSRTIKCKDYEILDENDSDEWDSIPTAGQNFKCALSEDEKAFYIKTYSENAMLIRVELNLSSISIITTLEDDLEDVQLTGGLCGSILNIFGANETNSTNTTETCFSFASMVDTCELDPAVLADYWTVENLGIKWNIPEANQAMFPNVCSSENDKSVLKSFKNVSIDKATSLLDKNKFYTLFTDTTSNLMVTARYQPCSSNTAKLCNCAAYVKVGNDSASESKYAFVDFCDADPSTNANWKFYSTLSSIESGDFSLSSSFDQINCSKIIRDPKDNAEWSSIAPFKVSFKCARILQKNCETSFLRASYSTESVLVQLDHKCTNKTTGQAEYLKSVKVIPADTSFTTGGLCGNMVSNQCHLFSNSYGNINTASCPFDNITLGAYWRTKEKIHLKSLLSKEALNVECKTFNYDSAINTFKSNLLKSPQLINWTDSFVLYNHNLHTIVATKYSECDVPYPGIKMCNCGVYVRLNRTTTHFAFIDTCGSDETKVETFKHYDETIASQYPYEEISCSRVIKDEEDEDEWNKVPASFGHFKCATLEEDSCKTLVLKTIGDDYSNIRVKVEAHCSTSPEYDPITQITVVPSVRSEKISNGFCDKWSRGEDEEEVCLVESNDEPACRSSGNIDEIVETNSMKYYEESGLIKKGVNQAIVSKNPFVPTNNIDTSLQCASRNDPHMTTLQRRFYEFQREGDYYFYSYNQGLRVVLVYQNCGRSVYCNCGLYLTTDMDISSEKTLYINNCGLPNEKVTIDSQIDKEKAVKFFDAAPNFCQTGKDPANFEHWKELHGKKAVLKQFYCMNVGGKYYLRIMREKQISKYDVQISFYTSGNSFDGVELNPSLMSDTETGGICGRKGPVCSLYYLNKLNEEVCVENEGDSNFNIYAEYWKTINQIDQRSHHNKSRIDPQLNENRKIRYSNLLRAEAKLFAPASRQFSTEEAFNVCNRTIRANNDIQDSQADVKIVRNLEAWALDRIRMCALDVEKTGNQEWAKTHSDLLKRDIIEQILKDRNNFDQDLMIKNETLDRYKIRCPNDCVGPSRGTCLKNENCRYGSTCDYIVKCECKDPFGSSDCSVNLKTAPRFTVAQRCCDSRSMNCDVISILGDFSDSDDLVVSIVSQKDSKNSVELYAKAIDTHHVEIKFPYGSFPGIKESHHKIKIGLSYGKSNFSEQVIDFYDSRCRSCDEDTGVSDQLITDTCLSSSGVCSNFVKSYEASQSGNSDEKVCYDSSPCNSVFDIGLVFQSASFTDQDTFETIKNAFAELLGRFNLEQNRVHAGLMYYGKRISKLVTLNPKEQLNRKSIIQRMINMPLIPLPSAPVARALSFADRTIFSQSRKPQMTIPRIAVLVNGMAWEDEDPGQSADLLKTKDIELMTIGIGDRVNPGALASLATSSPVLISNDPPAVAIKKNAFIFDYPSEIFKGMSEIVQRICTLNARAKIDEPAKIRLAKRYDVNYFQVYVDASPFDSYVLIKVEELKGTGSFYCSFENPNPVYSDSCSSNKRAGRTGETYFLIEKPSSPRNLYFTIENFDINGGEFEVTVSYF